MTATLTALLLVADDDGWGGHMDWDGAWPTLMMLAMILFWVLVLAGLFWVVRTYAERLPGGGRTTAESRPPVEILDERLAEGAITVEEYESRRRVLTGAPPGEREA